ncbi:MAG: flagellar hook-length control protein FliK [Candidatus Eremiobacteraeota bacterium]|nr:flagellar hook-length control protein FliK [Candidatus Eremiobacteraeota bacterium]
MDNILISMINASKLQRGELKKGAQDVGDDFEKIFKDQFDSRAKEKDVQDTGRKTISQEQSRRQKGAEDKEEIQKKARTKYKMKTKAELKKHDPMLAALLEASIRNLDTMTLREKQALRLDMFSNKTGIGMKELEKMLAQRGLNLNQLTYQEIAQLTQKHSRSQVLSFLDELIRQRRDSQKIQAPTGMAQGELHQEGRPAAKVDETMTAKQMAEEAEKQIKREEVLDQIIKQIEVRTLKDRSEVAIKMNPEFLGQLKIKLELKEGRISANFDTTSALVREILEESQDDLLKSFSEKGLNLSGITIHMVEEEEIA